jgi:hypothetical protein
MSEKQDQANQQNALLSTGPTTAAGKSTAARNATKSGFWSADVLMPGESKDEFEEFEEGFLHDLNPVGTMESWCAQQVIACTWRLRRVCRVETEVLAEQSFPEKNRAPTLGRAYLNDCRGLNALSKLARDESRIERSLYRAYHELQRLQAARAGHYVPPPAVADVDVNIMVGSAGSVPPAFSSLEAAVVECIASSESH